MLSNAPQTRVKSSMQEKMNLIMFNDVGVYSVL